MNKKQELENVLKQAGSYEFVVVFKRQLDDDLNCGGIPIQQSELPLRQALLKQFINELQQVYDDCGMAGSFEVISGPSITIPEINK